MYFDAEMAKKIAEEGRKALIDVINKCHDEGIILIDEFDKTINKMNTEKVKETAENIKNEVVNEAKNLEEKVENLAENIKEKASEAAHNFADKVKSVFHHEKTDESSDEKK